MICCKDVVCCLSSDVWESAQQRRELAWRTTLLPISCFLFFLQSLQRPAVPLVQQWFWTILIKLKNGGLQLDPGVGFNRLRLFKTCSGKPADESLSPLVSLDYGWN